MPADELQSTSKPTDTAGESWPGLRHPNRLWLVALILGALFDVLFWGQRVGANFAIFSTLCVLAGGLLLGSEGLRAARPTRWLFIPLAFFAATSFLRKEPLTSFLAYSITVVLMGIIANSYRGGRWWQYRLPDYGNGSMTLIGSLLGQNAEFARRVNKQRGAPLRRLPVAAIFRGCSIALPVVLILAALLASADAVFNQQMTDLLRIFEDGRVFEYALRLLIVLVCAHLVAGAFLHAAERSGDERIAGDRDDARRRRLGFTEAAIVLGSVTLLFLLFVVVQFRYFFGGTSNIGAVGYTWSEYARRGFNELITVAFLSLLLIMGLGAITQRDGLVRQRVYSWLSIAIALEVLVILASAFQRLGMAIDWHGFSRLRLYPQIFLVWVGILFVVIVVLELQHRERHFALAFVVASLGFAVTLTLVNVDAAIVRRNVMRTSQGKNLNVGHLASLSTDAIPELILAYRDPALSSVVHEGLGAVLACKLYSDEMLMREPERWQAFNYSQWKALQLLEATRPLTGYRVGGSGESLRVRTPSNVLYECRGTY